MAIELSLVSHNNDIDRWMNTLSVIANRLESRDGREIYSGVYERISAYRLREKISIAFVGQYNAGKSTIIAALTGRRDIKISAGIATEKIDSFDWMGIKIVDTPGLFAGRKDHDAITYNEIDRADLLVFCITSELFDVIVLNNFRHLAQGRKFLPKILLVVNKMLLEAGDEETHRHIYARSLESTLGSDVMRSVAPVFIDAKAFVDGIDRKNTALVQLSHFDTLIDALNRFAQRRSLYARFDTPIRMLLHGIGASMELVVPPDDSDKATRELLNRTLEVAESSRGILRSQMREIADKTSSRVLQFGDRFVARLETIEATAVPALRAEIEREILNAYDDAIREIDIRVNEIAARLSSGANDIQESWLYQNVASRLAQQPKYEVPLGGASGVRSRLTAQMGNLGVILSTMDGVLRKQVTVASAGASQVGEQTMRLGHELAIQTVKSLNDSLGLQIQVGPLLSWLDKVDDFLGFVGPALTLMSAVAGVAEIAHEKEREAKLTRQREEIQDRFSSISAAVRDSIDCVAPEIEKALFEPILRKIKDSRATAERELAKASDDFRDLQSLRSELEDRLDLIASRVPL